MSLKPKSDAYASDRTSAQKSTQFQIDFVRDNFAWLAKVDKHGTHRKFMDEIGPVAFLKDWEVSRIEKIYELVWKGYEMPAVNEHVDKKRKGLRF
jgi:hypothetical protein